MHARRVYKVFEIKNLRDFHGSYVQSDILFPDNVFENFGNMCLEMYELNLAWQGAFRKTKAKLGLLTDNNVLLMAAKRMNMSLYLSICKGKNKYMRDYDKNKELSYLHVNNLDGWAMSQKLSVNNFECIEDISQFNKDFIKNYNEESDEGYFLEVHVQYPENIHNLDNNLPFLPVRMKTGNRKSLQLIYVIKLNMLYI